MQKKILVADNDPSSLGLVDQALTEHGFEVLKASDGREALRLLFSNKPDLVLLATIMSGISGWQTCRRIREVSNIPIVLLIGREKVENSIVRGLECGADGYIVKPVRSRELLTRVRTLLKRAELSRDRDTRHDEIAYSDGYLTVDIAKHKVTVKGEQVKLTPREFRILAHLIDNAGRILTHKEVLQKVWGWEYTDAIDYVRVYICHLRRKIEPDRTLPRYILTKAGVGYYFEKLDERPSPSC